MPVSFFTSELQKARDRFNAIYGETRVCDLRMRQSLIAAICWMGVLEKRIARSGSKTADRTEIQRFVRLKNSVNSIFNRIETESDERRTNGTADDAERWKDRGTGFIR